MSFLTWISLLTCWRAAQKAVRAPGWGLGGDRGAAFGSTASLCWLKVFILPQLGCATPLVTEVRQGWCWYSPMASPSFPQLHALTFLSLGIGILLTPLWASWDSKRSRELYTFLTDLIFCEESLPNWYIKRSIWTLWMAGWEQHKAVGRIAASDLSCLKLSWKSNCFVAVKV